MAFSQPTMSLINLLAYPWEGTMAEKTSPLAPEDWRALLEEAEKRALTLTLYYRLRVAHGEALVPEWVWEHLQTVYLAATARNMVMLHHAAGILRALQERGIEVIVLKGLYLVEQVYPEIGLRTFSDLDLLVRREQLADALTLMQNQGYRLSTWYDPQAQNTDIKHLPPLEKAQYPTLELHWSILEEDEPFEIEAAGLWERAVETTIAGVKTRALDSEDFLLHLALHFTYQHRLRGGLRNLYDIAEVLEQRMARMNWQKLLATAQQWGAQRVTWLTFQLVEGVTGVTAPKEVMTALLPEGADSSAVGAALEQAGSLDDAWAGLTPDLAAFSAAGFFGKIKLLIQRVFISHRVLAREYNINPASPLIMVYYLARVRDLWGRYARSGWRIVAGEEEALAGADFEQQNTRLREWMRGTGKF
ncbi:MAG: nucleotidyltransferase family protein [Chloroflexi bacterium]|nr:nucleotidyltransferase family protein [Chloroflexota bacterium]